MPLKTKKSNQTNLALLGILVLIGIMSRVFATDLGDRDSIPG